ncbi:cell wall integrity and stress response component 4-like [Pecten maximus]|uniref:cell wall integrity and stress response component 4-like n=1 Tax=Pecten maximus TaxID=6579 RepID=UPI001458CF6C|nr:cell wall integrity and stress response component 4-like [Pecten maximus]
MFPLAKTYVMDFVRRIFANLVYLYGILTVVYVTAEKCENVRTETFSNKYLEGSGYKSVSPYGYQQCVMMCMVARECQSINYDLTRLDCELNTETTQVESSLTDKDGYIFKDMNATAFPTPPTGNCQKTTCPEYHTCADLTNGNTMCTAPVSDVPTTTTTTTSTTTTTIPTTTTTTTTIPTTTTTTTTTPTTTTTAGALTCVAPYTTNALSGLCLYRGDGYTWTTAINGCPYPGRLFVADTGDKQDAAAALCPSATSCWLGAEYTNNDFHWSTGEIFSADQRGSGDCLRVRDSVFKGGGCSNAVSYICEQV